MEEYNIHRRPGAAKRFEDGILGDGKTVSAGQKNRRSPNGPVVRKKRSKEGNKLHGSNNIDHRGFRLNVGIILLNECGQVLWARRIGGKDAWQFPQGGVDSGEEPEQAMYRELFEEVGLTRNQVSLLACTRGWLRYRLPQRLVRRHSEPLCIGQKQKWYLLRLEAAESNISFDNGYKPEFDRWRWVNYWHPLTKVVAFKCEVYRRALVELAPKQIYQQKQFYNLDH